MDTEWFTAQRWLWQQRKNAPPNADILDFRFHWGVEQDWLWNAINKRDYSLSPMLVYRRAKGGILMQWCARDALVLIRKKQLWNQVARYITDARVVSLIKQYWYYCVDDGGEIHAPQIVIPRGCALSPVLGASLLYHIYADFR